MLDQDFEIFGKHSLSWAAGTGTSASNIAAWAAAVDASHDTLGFALGLVYTQWVFSAADLSGLLVAADYAWNHRHRTNYTVTNYTNYTPDVGADGYKDRRYQFSSHRSLGRRAGNGCGMDQSRPEIGR
jgi:hypothetical protein